MQLTVSLVSVVQAGLTFELCLWVAIVNVLLFYVIFYVYIDRFQSSYVKSQLCIGVLVFVT